MGAMAKRKMLTALCSECGRRTAVRRDGKLHAHKHPGWHTPCKCEIPLVTTAQMDDRQMALFKGKGPR